MKKRLRKGFTVTEVLIATAILAIFVSMAVVGTSALFGTGEQMMTVSKAAVLGSDVMKAVTNELRFGEAFQYTPESEGAKQGPLSSYNSTAYGESCKMEIGTEEHAGELVIVNTSKDKTFFPIGTAAYDEVRIKSITFTVTEENGRFIVTCGLAITSDGENVLWEKSVSTVPLYQKATV